jgi:hypothetical protein
MSPKPKQQTATREDSRPDGADQRLKELGIRAEVIFEVC